MLTDYLLKDHDLQLLNQVDDMPKLIDLALNKIDNLEAEISILKSLPKNFSNFSISKKQS